MSLMPIHDLLKYFGPLHDDIERCLIGIEIGEDVEYWRRSYLRCLCTFIEARVYLIKLELKENNHLISHSLLAPEVIYFLSGTEWNVGNNGDIKSRVKVVSPLDELKAVIKILGAIYPNLLWDFGSRRWTRVKEIYKSRNALVHPKKPMDLFVAEKEIHEFEIFRKDFNSWAASIYFEAWGKPDSEAL